MANFVQPKAAQGRCGPRQHLELFSEQQLKADAGYVNTVAQLATRLPNKDYWTDLLNAMGRVPGISARTQLDVSRLMDAAGTMHEGEDLIDTAQFAIKAISLKRNISS